MNIKYLLVIVVIIGFAFPCKLSAQNRRGFPYKRNTPAYIHYLSTNYGITIEKSPNFIDLHKYYVPRITRKDSQKVAHVGYDYGPIFVTKNKECVIMYPSQPIYMTPEDKERAKKMTSINRSMSGDTSTVVRTITTYIFTRGQLIHEIKANTGLYNYFGKPLSDSVHFHFNDHVTTMAGKKPNEMFNADTLYMYELPIHNIDPLPLPKSNHKKYTNRTSLVLFKRDRASIFFKLFFTPKGKKEEWKYINMLAGHVWYKEEFKHIDE